MRKRSATPRCTIPSLRSRICLISSSWLHAQHFRELQIEIESEGCETCSQPTRRRLRLQPAPSSVAVAGTVDRSRTKPATLVIIKRSGLAGRMRPSMTFTSRQLSASSPRSSRGSSTAEPNGVSSHCAPRPAAACWGSCGTAAGPPGAQGARRSAAGRARRTPRCTRPSPRRGGPCRCGRTREG